MFTRASTRLAALVPLALSVACGAATIEFVADQDVYQVFPGESVDVTITFRERIDRATETSVFDDVDADGVTETLGLLSADLTATAASGGPGVSFDAFARDPLFDTQVFVGGGQAAITVDQDVQAPSPPVVPALTTDGTIEVRAVVVGTVTVTAGTGVGTAVVTLDDAGGNGTIVTDPAFDLGNTRFSGFDFDVTASQFQVLVAVPSPAAGLGGAAAFGLVVSRRRRP